MTPDSPRDENEKRATEARPAQWSVLLAEDLQDLQALMAMWLEEAGHRVTRASSGREVIDHATRSDFDLLVTDILMPDGDGVKLIEELKKIQPATHILAISGGGRFVDGNNCLKIAHGLGADAAVMKPFKRDQFLAAVDQALAPRQSKDA